MKFNPLRLLLPCRFNEPELWFSKDPSRREQAIQLCRECPLRAECLEVAMRAEGAVMSKYRYGIYGGLVPLARWKLYVARKREAERLAKAVEEEALAS